MICVKCEQDKGSEFYKNDKTCKECRKAMVRNNRAKKAEYYREYDKKRYQNDPRVKERHRRYSVTEAGKVAAQRAKDKWQKSNPIKRAANIILRNAVRDGRIKKPGFCAECGNSGVIHGHHDDYAFPLIVRWLCAKCHKKWHQEHGEGKNAS